MPRSEAPQRPAAAAAVFAPSSIAEKRSRSSAALSGAERWYAKRVSKTTSGEGWGVLIRGKLPPCELERNAGAELPTPRLNKVLADALQVNPPPLVRGRQVRLRYAHQGGRYPPLVVVHGGQAERLPAHYKRYLENAFREALKLKGTPVRLVFKTGDNPFKGRRNQLTERQQTKRKRLMKHVKR